jgi:hypothetical protein
MAASLASCEAIWFRKLLAGLSGRVLEPTVIYCNNQSCVNSWRIECYMTDRNTLRSYTTSSETGCRREI